MMLSDDTTAGRSSCLTKCKLSWWPVHRKVQADAELEALRDQCLDLRVQISLLMDKQTHEPTTIAALLSELAALESRIRKRRLPQ